MDIELAKVFAQYGFPAIVAGGLLAWMLRSLNGKLDRLSDGVGAMKEATAENTYAVRSNTEKLDMLLRKLE